MTQKLDFEYQNYNIFKYLTMKEVLLKIFTEEYLNMISHYYNDNNENNQQFFESYGHLFTVGNDKLLITPYDWFPHVLILHVNSFCNSPEQIANKINPNYKIINWDNRKYYTKDFLINNIFNWDKFKIVEKCQKCSVKKSMIIDIEFSSGITSYCKMYYPSMAQADQKGCCLLLEQ
jgi:hypothetical protein